MALYQPGEIAGLCESIFCDAQYMYQGDKVILG